MCRVVAREQRRVTALSGTSVGSCVVPLAGVIEREQLTRCSLNGAAPCNTLYMLPIGSSLSRSTSSLAGVSQCLHQDAEKDRGVRTKAAFAGAFVKFPVPVADPVAALSAKILTRRGLVKHAFFGKSTGTSRDIPRQPPKARQTDRPCAIEYRKVSEKFGGRIDGEKA